jgi:uncharacterized phage protein (TIGR02220 family)
MYYSYKVFFQNLDGDDAKALLLAMFDFDENGIRPKLDLSIQTIFEFMARQLETDKAKYFETCERRKEAGKKGGLAKAAIVGEMEADADTKDKQKLPNASLAKQRQTRLSKCNHELPSLADNDSDSDNDSDCDSIYDTKEQKNIKKKNPQNAKEISDIISHLNNKTGKHFRDDSRETIKHINGRLDEGYTIDDFFKVIDNKCNEWLDDVKMSKYLQPSTLFSVGHFEEYLNQSEPKKPHDEWENLEERLLAETERTINMTI